ncbi:MAG: bifunctional phosphoribosylaminoimidazolecarboxamide formyltransferase/IMP cyclohydrolase PurH, partial [Bacteroidales bacterium]
DTFIANYFKNTLSPQESLNATHANSTPKNAPENSPKKQNKVLRYGENPHQQGVFYGDLSQCFTQLHGKEISYNNLLDIDAALALIQDFSKSTFAILKHNNACGLSTRKNLLEAYTDALAADPVSAFGGVLICNDTINKEIAQAMNSLFFEVLLAPDFEEEALEILQGKKNRIL